MKSERWERLAEIFYAAVALTGDERSALLAGACADDPALRADVERLIAAHERAGRFIESPAILSVGAWLDERSEPPVVDRSFGPYRVVREIGRGGMGAVYLAERADGQYEQRVALKLIKRGMDTDLVLRRFRAERQILASLDHPNIARLLDGGTSDDGRPYFVMEYIEGEPIDEYADARHLSIPERLRLFLHVCSAVAYAHRHLVIHRDIKPLNILVTPSGVPKLLDFGIAKVLNPGADEPTSSVTGLRLLTPEYASPEQVDGHPATTVSDVYSLGVVLYELLTGRSPYQPRSPAPLDVVEAVRTTDPERPSSAVARARSATAERSRRRGIGHDRAAVTATGSIDRLQRRLRGDLDTIVLTALRKEPARRYQSVEQLAADIERHLAGHPVLARADSFRYRAAKFVRRNRVVVAAATLVTLALLGGTAATAWEAHAARAAQLRAERRFSEVRRLANALIFDYHDAIKDLPGATPVRERLLRDALSYLDTLAREAQGDRSLQRDLAIAYRRVGDLQGGSAMSNLGNTEGALESYRKAMRLLEALLRADSNDARTSREIAGLAVALGNLTFDAGDIATSLAYARRARVMLEPLATTGPIDATLRLELNAADDLFGVLTLEGGDPEASAELHRKNLARLESAPEAEQRSPRLRRAHSVTLHHLADALVQLGDLRGALDAYQRSETIRKQLAAEFPGNTDYRGLVRASNYWIAEVLAAMGRPAEALVRYRTNLTEDSAMVRADPKNAEYRSGLAFSLSRVADMLLTLGRAREALADYRQSLRLREVAFRADPDNLFKRLQLIESHGRICRTLASMAPSSAAAECALTTTLMHETPMAPTNAGFRGYMAGAYSDLGAVYDSLAASPATPPAARYADRLAALDAYRRSSAIWSDLAARGILNPVDTGRVSAAARAVERAEVAVRQVATRSRPH